MKKISEGGVVTWAADAFFDVDSIPPGEGAVGQPGETQARDEPHHSRGLVLWNNTE